MLSRTIEKNSTGITSLFTYQQKYGKQLLNYQDGWILCGLSATLLLVATGFSNRVREPLCTRKK